MNRRARLGGKAAIVTGGASGIGLAIARKMASEGAALVIADLDNDAATRAADELTAAGDKVVAMRCDVSSADGADAMVAACLSAYGRLDVLVNNAGVGTDGKRLADCDEDEWDRVVRIDLKSVFLCMKAALPALVASGNGSIVNVSSVAAIVAWRGTGPYTAAKGGVVALTRATAAEYARLGVRVNCLCPGVTETPLMERATGGRSELFDRFIVGQPMARHGQPEDMAGMAVYLASDDSSFVTGGVFPVDGGYTAV